MPGPEFQEIELLEDPDRNWRQSYYQVFVRQRQQMIDERTRGKSFIWRVGFEAYNPLYMDDEEITEAAREHARRTVEKSINRHRESLEIRRRRNGIAL